MYMHIVFLFLYAPVQKSVLVLATQLDLLFVSRKYVLFFHSLQVSLGKSKSDPCMYVS